MSFERCLTVCENKRRADFSPPFVFYCFPIGTVRFLASHRRYLSCILRKSAVSPHKRLTAPITCSVQFLRQLPIDPITGLHGPKVKTPASYAHISVQIPSPCKNLHRLSQSGRKLKGLFLCGERSDHKNNSQICQIDAHHSHP